ncbi:MAG: hypothetical protein ACOYKA_01535 [Legionellaceae bacterium]
MTQTLRQLLRQLPPFILVGVVLAFAIALFVVFSYVLLWGLLVGSLLWLISAIFQYVTQTSQQKKTQNGRIIDIDKDHDKKK